MANKSSEAKALREKAEAKFKQREKSETGISAEMAMELMQELEIHQIELEMQNEELREAQHHLEEVRDQYTNLFDFAPVGYLILDAKGTIKNINLTACDLLGLERMRINGSPLSNFMSAGESSKLYLNLKEAFKTEKLPAFELQMKPVQGPPFTALIQGSCWEDASFGEKVCRISLQDITELKKTESLQLRHEMLRREKENIQQYLELAPVVFLLLDTDQKVQMINQKGCDLLGYDRTEIIGKNWFQHFIENSGEGLIDAVSHHKLLLVPQFESWVKCRDGALRLVAWTNTSLIDKSGNIIGTLSAGEDITERKHREKNKERYVLGLEEIVKDRTKELSDALESEKQINELKSAFVSIASHELRTPITIIMSSIILIEKYAVLGQHDHQQKHIDRIKSSVSHFKNILEDFLSLDRLERGIVRVSKDTFNIKDFVKSVIDEMEGILKPGQLVNFSHKGAVEVVMDKKIMRNILINLISNAIKFSETDIDIKSVVMNGLLAIDVSDRGIGIPENEQPLLFKRFFRAKNVENIQGTGLGLSIVQRYVELMGGNIAFASKLNEGSSFTIKIPQDGD